MSRKNRRLILGISVLVLLLILSSTVYTNHIIYQSVVKQSGERGLSIVRAMSELVDVDLIMDIVEKNDKGNPDYLNMLELFEKVCIENEALYLYTVHYDKEGIIRYGIVADGEEDTLGLIVDENDITSELLLTLDEGLQTYEQPYAYEQWGNLMTSNTPIRNKEGKIVGALAVDFSQESIVKKTRSLLSHAMLIISGFGLLLSIMTWFLLNKILKLSVELAEKNNSIVNK